MEEVQCAECGTRYNSQVQAFCPRCGNEGSRPLRELPPVRYDPKRRRAQMGGLILAALGLVALLQLGWVAVSPEPLSDVQLQEFSEVALFQDQPGGDMMLRVVRDGEPAEAAVVWRDMDGTGLANATTKDGWANATGLGSAFGRAEIQAADGTNHTVSFYAPAGGSFTTTVDLSDPPAWVGARQVSATRVVSGLLAFFAAFVMAAGILAFRLRAWRIALAGSILALMPALVVGLLSPLAGLFLLVPSGLALAFIVGGRRHFLAPG